MPQLTSFPQTRQPETIGSAVVVVGNVNDLFPGKTKNGNELWQKAVSLSFDDRSVMVTPRVPANVDPPRAGMWAAPANVVIPQHLGSSVADALVADASAFERLVGALSPNGEVELRFQVWSDSMQRLREKLVDVGVRLRDTLPSVGPATVADWNTKVGGHVLMASIPALAPYRPPAAIVHSLSQLETLISGTNTPVVVKANSESGGAGIWLSGHGASLPRWVRTDSSSLASGKKGLASVWPVLAEAFVGEATTNVSVTMDLWIYADRLQEIGSGRQLLRDRFKYRGVASDLGATTEVVRETTSGLASIIAEELRRRGYRGPLNIDFIVTRDRRVYVAELNVRQSAPFDSFEAVTRLYGTRSTKPHYIALDDLPVPSLAVTASDVTLELDKHFPDGAVTCLSISNYGRKGTRCSLLAVAENFTTAKRLLGQAATLTTRTA